MPRTHIAYRFLVAFSVLLFAGCSDELVDPGLANYLEPGLEHGVQIYDTCVPCHGVNAEGSDVTGAPALAGQEQWYVEAQLVKFLDGIRGAHPDDYEGLKMRAMARTLRPVAALDDAHYEGDVASVAEYISAMPAVNLEPTLVGGNAAAGEARYQICIACHGADASGNETLNAPSLQGLNDWYIMAQLHKFKVGIRGADPRDITGMQMRGMAMTLPDDQAVLDVIAYIQTLGN